MFGCAATMISSSEATPFDPKTIRSALHSLERGTYRRWRNDSVISARLADRLERRNMKKNNRIDDLRDHYDFSGGVRGKYARRYAEGTNVVVLDLDVARLFRNREAVNETLRAVAQIVQIQERRQGRADKAVSPDRGSATARHGRRKSRSGRGG